MSKVISFSISDRYLDKLRSLYPALTDNLAAKQFLTDGLESSLGNSLDGSLDDGLDGKLKTLIESELDDVLDERLDAVMGKLITSLSERMARLEERLDDSLDGRLDDNMEPLLKRERECSIATAPIPTGETSPDEPVQPAIETVTPEVSPSPPSPPSPLDAIGTLPTVEAVEPISTIETVASAIEDPEKKIMEPVGGSDSLDTLPVPPITDKTIDQNAIETVPGETDSIEPVTGEGMNPNQAHEYLISKGIEDTSYYYLNKWAKAGVIDTSPQGKNAIKHLILRGKLYFPKTDQP